MVWVVGEGCISGFCLAGVRVSVAITVILRSLSQHEKPQATLQHPTQVNIAGSLLHNVIKRKKKLRKSGKQCYNQKGSLYWHLVSNTRRKSSSSLCSFLATSVITMLLYIYFYYTSSKWGLNIPRYRGNIFKYCRVFHGYSEMMSEIFCTSW